MGCVKKGMVVGLSLAVLNGCSVRESRVHLQPIFAGNPYDSEVPMTWTPPPSSKPPLAKVDRIVLGVGSGRDGFETIEVDSGGGIEVIRNVDTDANQYRARKVVDGAAASEILSSDVIAGCLRLGGRYRSDMFDGTQGFLSMRDGEREAFVWFDNYFPKEFSAAWNELASRVNGFPAPSWGRARRVNGHGTYLRASRGDAGD